MDKLASILSEINEIKQIINQMPEEAVIEKISFQNRLDKILLELEEYVKTRSERLLSHADDNPDPCEGCRKPAKYQDAEGIQLCPDCYIDLLHSDPLLMSAPELLKLLKGAIDYWHGTIDKEEMYEIEEQAKVIITKIEGIKSIEEE